MGSYHIEEDDLTKPQAHEAMPYLNACRLHVQRSLRDFMTDNDHGRAADVLFRRATEAFLAEVFADAKRLGGEPIHAETFKEASR